MHDNEGKDGERNMETDGIQIERFISPNTESIHAPNKRGILGLDFFFVT